MSRLGAEGCRAWLARAAAVVVLAVAPLACRGAGEAVRYEPPKRIASIQDERLDECSGLAASRRNTGILWAHNDSGDEPRLFALDMKGNTRAVVQVAGARARDWEDIAAGPGPDGRPSLYIGDIGNNGRDRDNLTVYCVPEPLLAQGESEARSEKAVAYPFRYPDGNFDAEALMVHPKTGDIYLITKRDEETTGVYRFPKPLKPGERVTLERAATLALHQPSIWARKVTGADIAPDGSRFAVRTYGGLFEFAVPAGKPFVTAFATAPRSLQPPMELQGEAVCYLADGEGLVTTSEGIRPNIHVTRRAR